MIVNILRICFLSVVLMVVQNVCTDTLCSPPCLLVSNTTDISAVDYKAVKVRSIISGLKGAVALDVHFNFGYIFWSDVIEKNIKRFRIDTANTTTIITGIGVCNGLAVDWRASQLYWTDTTQNTISVSDLDGNNQTILINSYLDKPRAIALDLDNRLMIWSVAGTHPKIEKASLSGNQRVTVVTTFLFNPNGIDLDRGNKRIFWVDAGYDTVESINYNGRNRKILYQDAQRRLHPFGVALIAPLMFFIDWNTKLEVHKLDASTGEVLRSFSINGGIPMGIVAYDSTRQPPASSSCAVNNGGCSHFCVTKTRGYECVCPTGLTVKEDGNTCEDRVRKFILFADAEDSSTNYFSLDVSYFVSQTLFKSEGNSPVALDFDPVEDRVYWSDPNFGGIFSAFSNRTSAKTLFYCNVKSPDGLAIDHVGRNIYWTDSGTKRIEVGRLDGKSRRVLIKDGLDEPRAIALAERNGMMFWTDWGTPPKIEQAEMDGSVRRAIVTEGLGWPNGLTYDQATNHLFWADAKLDKIEKLDLNGGGRSRQLIILPAANIHPFGLTMYQDTLYWTDWNTKSISRFNLSSRRQETIIYGLKQPMDIHVFDPSLIFSGPHNCSGNNGLCSDLCLLKPGGYQCACPTGIGMKSDGKNCDYDAFYKTSSENFMIVAEGHMGKFYKVPLKVPEAPCFPLGISAKISRPVAVDYDPVEGKVYWTDVILKLVARAFLNGSSVEVIAHINVDIPAGLAVDYVGRTIYWTDEGTSKIEVAKLDGLSRRGLITSNIERPRAILLDIGERKMYWGGRGLSLKIEQANMDGSARRTLVSSRLLFVNSLAMDYKNRLLYWCDAGLDKIERVDLQGNNRVVILDLSSDFIHPFGLALLGDTLFWSDWNHTSVNKYNMTTSQNEIVVHGMKFPMELHIHVTCPPLSIPPRAHLLNDSCGDKYGSNCVFGCQTGYVKAEGNVIRSCLQTGQWSGKSIRCIAVTCPPLSIPPRAHLLNDSCGNTYGSNCVFGCQTGYVKAEGNVIRTCLQTGQWSGKSIRCKEISNSTDDTSHVAIAVGSSVGGVALFALIVGAILFVWKRGLRIRGRKHSREQESIGQRNLGYQDRVHIENSYLGNVELQQANGIRRVSAEGDQMNAASSVLSATAGCSTSAALNEGCNDRDSHNHGVEAVQESHCLCIASKVGVFWRDVLRNLGIPEMTIRNLDEDHKSYGVAEKSYQGLLKWKEKLGPQKATIKKLCDALVEVGCSEALEALRSTLDQSDC